MAVSLEKFYEVIKAAKVLDGDLILQGENNDQKLKKVNYGGSYAYGKGWDDRRVTATENQSKDARIAFWNAINENAKLTGLSPDLKEVIKKMLGITGDREHLNLDASSKPLSRRLVRLVFDTLDANDALKDFKAQKGVGEMKRVGARAFGGKNGMTVNQKQFNGIFDQLEQRMDSLTGLNSPIKKAAFLELAAECKRLFVEGRTEGVLRDILSDGLDIKSIADRMVAIVTSDNHILPVPTCGIAGTPAVGVLAPDTAKLMDDFRLRVEKSGMDVIDEKIKLTGDLQSQNELPNNIVAEIIYSRDPMELSRGGIANGERLGRILMSRPDEFFELLKDTSKDYLKQNETYIALKNVDKSIAQAFEKTLKAVIKAVFTNPDGKVNLKDENKTAFPKTCFGHAQEIFKAIAKGGVEKAINKAFSDNGKSGDNPIRKTIHDGLMKALGFMSKEGVMVEDDHILNKRGEQDLNGVFARKVLVEMLRGATPDRLRQLYAAGLREHRTFNAVETLFEAGPYAQKLVQGFSDDKLSKEVTDVLKRMRGKLPSIDRNIVKVQLLQYLEATGKTVEDVSSIEISNGAGSASVGETFKGVIHFKDSVPDKNIVIKQLRPDVEWKFSQDAQAIGNRLDAEEKAALKRKDKDAKAAVDHVRTLRNIMLSTEVSIRQEFDFNVEQLNALRSLANTLNENTVVVQVVDRNGVRRGVPDTAKLVKSMGLILKPRKTESDFINALKAAASDEGLKGVMEDYLIPSQKSCMICEDVPGRTIDKEIKEVKVPKFDLSEAKKTIKYLVLKGPAEKFEKSVKGAKYDSYESGSQIINEAERFNKILEKGSDKSKESNSIGDNELPTIGDFRNSEDHFNDYKELEELTKKHFPDEKIDILKLEESDREKFLDLGDRLGGMNWRGYRSDVKTNSSGINDLLSGFYDNAKTVLSQPKEFVNAVVKKAEQVKVKPQSVDYSEKTLNENKGLKKLFSIKRELLALTKRSVEGLFFGKIPYLHGDLHASNLMRSSESEGLSSLVMIDHGKAIVLDEKQRELYKELILAANKSTQTINGVALARAFRNIVADEVLRLETAAKNDKKNGETGVNDKVLRSLQETLDKLNDAQCFTTFCRECRELGDINAFGVLESMRKIAIKQGLMIPQKLYDFLGTLGKLQNAIDSVEEKISSFRLLAVKQKALEIYESKTFGVEINKVVNGRDMLETGIKNAENEDQVCNLLHDALKTALGENETTSNELFDSVMENRGTQSMRLKAVGGLGIGNEVRLWQDEELKDLPCSSTQDILDIVLGDGIRTVESVKKDAPQENVQQENVQQENVQQKDNQNIGRIQDVEACGGDTDKLYRLYYRLPIGTDIKKTWEEYTDARKEAETKVLEAALEVLFRESVNSLVYDSYNVEDSNYGALNQNTYILELRNMKVKNGNMPGNNAYDQKCNEIAKRALESYRQDRNGFDLLNLLSPDGIDSTNLEEIVKKTIGFVEE